MYSITKKTKDNRTLLIREAKGDDAKAVLAYINQVCGETDFLTFGLGEFKLTEKEEIDYLEKSRHSANMLYLLAFLDGKIVGGLTFQTGTRPRVAHVGEFGITVLKAHWGLNIGSFLLDSLIEWAKHTHFIKKINLSVRSDNQRAIALYKHKGFIVEGHLKNEMFINGIYYDTLSMGLELNAIIAHSF